MTEKVVLAVHVGSEDSGGNLAVVMRAFEGGGAQRDMVLLCNALFAKGVRLTILVLRNEGRLRCLLDPGIEVIEVAGQRLRYAIPGLRKALRALAPGCVVSSEAALNLCSFIAVRSLPRRDRPRLVLREVGSPSLAQRHDPHPQNRAAYRVLRYLYRHADRIITLTGGARRDLIQNFSVPERIISVMRANAVVPPAGSPAGTARPAARRISSSASGACHPRRIIERCCRP
ncbi:MAG TPA: glycosyltransferase [Xanthobacteraceae bacterium]